MHTFPARLLLATLLLVQAPAHALDIGQFPVLDDFIRQMIERHDMREYELRELFANATFKPEIIEAMERPKEGLPWHEYRKLFVTAESARNGLKYWKANAEALFRAHSEFGVDPEIIVAIIGVETRYGRSTGSHRVFDALTTLTAGYPKRSDYFRKELEEFLLLVEELRVDPFSIKGSYAGAMGVPQFMPSSYRRYAVDFDGDHRRNILHSTDDAIGSVANYFSEHGWKKNQPVIDRVEIKGTLYGWLENNGNEPELTIKQLKKYGVIPVPGIDLKQLATLVTLEEETGPTHYLAYNNFHVIMRYNRSRRYAMAVYELSRQLHKLYYDEAEL